jgi:hypothetical protein
MAIDTTSMPAPAPNPSPLDAAMAFAAQLGDDTDVGALAELAFGVDPRDVWQQFADQHLWVWLASNPHTPSDLLAGWPEHLYNSPTLISRLLGNPATPPGVLVRLAGLVRYDQVVAVLDHPAVTDDALRVLAGRGRNFRGELALDARTPAWLLEHLCVDGGLDIPALRHLLAANPSTPPGRLAEIADHGDETTRTVLAANPSTPAEVRDRLLADPAVAEQLELETGSPF